MRNEKKLTRKVRREQTAARGGKDAAVAREQTAARQTQEKTGVKVVLANGVFSLAPVDFDAAPEAHASRKERLRRNGLSPEGRPAGGLPRDFAATLARKLQAARDRRQRWA